MEQFEGLEELSVELGDEPSVLEEGKKVVPTGSREHILNLQLVMATTSVNHEYARMEYEETKDIERKDELMIYMSECREKYDLARDELSCLNPLVLESFEAELAMQKRSTMVHYHA
jgi:hypothetical protein